MTSVWDGSISQTTGAQTVLSQGKYSHLKELFQEMEQPAAGTPADAAGKKLQFALTEGTSLFNPINDKVALPLNAALADPNTRKGVIELSKKHPELLGEAIDKMKAHEQNLTKEEVGKILIDTQLKAIAIDQKGPPQPVKTDDEALMKKVRSEAAEIEQHAQKAAEYAKIAHDDPTRAAEAGKLAQVEAKAALDIEHKDPLAKIYVGNQMKAKGQDPEALNENLKAWAQGDTLDPAHRTSPTTNPAEPSQGKQSHTITSGVDETGVDKVERQKLQLLLEKEGFTKNWNAGYKDDGIVGAKTTQDIDAAKAKGENFRNADGTLNKEAIEAAFKKDFGDKATVQSAEHELIKPAPTPPKGGAEPQAPHR